MNRAHRVLIKVVGHDVAIRILKDLDICCKQMVICTYMLLVLLCLVFKSALLSFGLLIIRSIELLELLDAVQIHVLDHFRFIFFGVSSFGRAPL